MKPRYYKWLAFFLTLASALAWQGCQEEEEGLYGIFPDSPAENAAANRFLEQLAGTPGAEEAFARALAGDAPRYEGVQLAGHIDYGLCYFIPYGDRQVKGAIYYPVGAEQSEDGVYHLDGTLGNPDRMDAYRINNEIGITKRYLYSAPFKKMQREEWDVDPALVECAELLEGNFIPISQEESTVPHLPTKASEDYMVMLFRYYDPTYIGNKTDAVYGLNPETTRRIFYENLKKMGIRDANPYDIKHRYCAIEITISLRYVPQNIERFVRQLAREVELDLFKEGFSVLFTYEYNVVTADLGSGGSGSGSGSGSGIGGSGTGNNTSGDPSVDEKVRERAERAKKMIPRFYDERHSTLTLEQKEKLFTALEEFIDECDPFCRMFWELASETSLIFEINPERLEKVKGKAGYRGDTIMFYDESYIEFQFFKEELIHAVQDHNVYGINYMDDARKNIEFEAKVIQDIVSQVIGISGGGWIGSMGHSNEYINSYRNWIDNCQTNGMAEFISKFDDFCRDWRGYGGAYRQGFVPETIKKYFRF